MGLWDRLFGKKKQTKDTGATPPAKTPGTPPARQEVVRSASMRGSAKAEVGRDQPAATTPLRKPSPTVAQPPTGRLPDRFRHAHCDICRKDLPARVNEADASFFIPGGVMTNKDPFSIPDVIGACPKCDIDVCGSCAQWVKDGRPMGEMSKQAIAKQHGQEAVAQVMDRLTADPEAGRLLQEAILRPLCPRCRGDLSQKSPFDIERLKRAEDDVKNASLAKKEDFVLRQRRIIREERPFLERFMGKTDVDAMDATAVCLLYQYLCQGLTTARETDAQRGPWFRIKLIKQLLIDERAVLLRHFPDANLKAMDEFTRKASSITERIFGPDTSSESNPTP